MSNLDKYKYTPATKNGDTLSLEDKDQKISKKTSSLGISNTDNHVKVKESGNFLTQLRQNLSTKECTDLTVILNKIKKEKVINNTAIQALFFKNFKDPKAVCTPDKISCLEQLGALLPYACQEEFFTYFSKLLSCELKRPAAKKKKSSSVKKSGETDLGFI